MLSFFQGKRVFLTGHTGFKGAWLSFLLIRAGAEVTGYSLEPPTTPNLFSLLPLQSAMHSIIGDIRDKEALLRAMEEARPEIVLHLAAQPIVRESYRDPVATYETNVMGTVHLLESVRHVQTVRSLLNVTTDKVYENREWVWGYRETDPLDGFDPYSNSKSCSELVTHSYKKAFFADGRVAVSTARAGNVIGGGDFAKDRIIPDAVRAALAGNPFTVRNPDSIRPYQHVLEPLFAYLLIAMRQSQDGALAGFYNVGPDDCDCVTTGKMSTLFCDAWGENMAWINQRTEGPHEATFLKLDCSKLKSTFGWRPVWHAEEAVARTVAWTKAYRDRQDLESLMTRQAEEFLQTAQHAWKEDKRNV